LAGHINGHMPHFVVDKVRDGLNAQKKPVNGSRILVAGITYKRDIDDMRESPALDVLHLLHKLGAQVSYADPYVPVLPADAWAGGEELRAVLLDQNTLSSADCVVIVTDHRAFDVDQIVHQSKLVIDTRNATKIRAPHVVRLGAPVPAGQATLA
jgi:UDP-N-acetyl-D-glucosamine dehydrogenase